MKRPTAFNQSWSFGLDFLGWCAKGPPPLPCPPFPGSVVCWAWLGLAALMPRELAAALSCPRPLQADMLHRFVLTPSAYNMGPAALVQTMHLH